MSSYRDVPHTNQDDDDEEAITAAVFAEQNSHSTWLRRYSRRMLYTAGCSVVVVIFVVILAVVVGNGGGGGASYDSLTPVQMEEILREASATGGTEFNNPDTYQSKALQWLKDNPVHEHIMSPSYRLKQRFALACLYYATYQQTNDWLDLNLPTDKYFPWKESKGWLVFNDECDWSGVDCNSQGYVTDLDVGSNDLSGRIPPELTYLAASLEVLNIENNYAYNRGNAGNAFLGKLTNLEYLYMRDSLFQNDGIPTHFGLLTSLKELDCSYSLYHGSIDGSTFDNLSSLRYLEISGNAINSTIPAQVASLPSLKYFYAANCGLTGNLEFVLQMPVVVETWLDRNPELQGPIPEELGPKMTTLESFSVTRSGLTGTLPTTLGEFDRMKQLWFYLNDLTGTIPTEIGKLEDLQTFEVEGNNIGGEVPEEVCDLTEDESLSSLHADCGDNGANKVECICCHCCGPVCVEPAGNAP